MKTKPTGARRAQRTKPQTNAAEAAPQIDVARSVWNTLGAAKLLGLTPARVVRAVASGQLYSSRRIIGGDGKPRFAFSHSDLRDYAFWLVPDSKDGQSPAYVRERVAAHEAINALVR
jgi:hypothetical protein